MTFKIAKRKVVKERMWSLAIVGLLTLGLTTWMVVPSISASLQRGLSSYSNSIATYIYVYHTEMDNHGQRIPIFVNDEIAAIQGVQEVYPIISNRTYFFDVIQFHFTLPDGTETTTKSSIGGFLSAVIGGQGGFPQVLANTYEGRSPGNEAGFLTNSLTGSTLKLNQTYVVGFTVPCNSSDGYLKFNATAIGQIPYNPMLQQVEVLWNSTFLQQMLGKQGYESTFGGEGANLFIIKAQDIKQVEPVAEKLKSIFSSYPGYSVVFDQQTIEAQMSFESGSGVLYDLIGIMLLFSVISIIFLFTYVFSLRRKWEVGLMITQGWGWQRVNNLFLQYYLILGLISGFISVAFSLFLGNQINYSFQVYGSTLAIPVSISLDLVTSGFILSLLVSVVAARFAVWRMRKMGLDNLLREH